MRSRKLTLLILVVGLVGLTVRLPTLADTPRESHATTAIVAPAEAMRRLVAGNERFANQKMTGERRDAARRKEVAGGQSPFAIVLGCADSRVPPEVVFDQGLGDLFVIRVAGEVASPEVIGSVEYAVEHLGCRAIVVLGHDQCGAVEAALNSGAAPPGGNLGTVIKDILPAIQKIDRHSPDALDAAVRLYAKAAAEALVERSPELHDLTARGELLITPARYDLDTGLVELMPKIMVAPKQEH